jgi:hypothetical protein
MDLSPLVMHQLQHLQHFLQLRLETCISQLFLLAILAAAVSFANFANK